MGVVSSFATIFIFLNFLVVNVCCVVVLMSLLVVECALY